MLYQVFYNIEWKRYSINNADRLPSHSPSPILSLDIGKYWGLLK